VIATAAVVESKCTPFAVDAGAEGAVEAVRRHTRAGADFSLEASGSPAALRDVPQIFLPQVVRFWEEGRFPVERLMTHYDFDRIDDAVHAAESGEVIKPVLRMS
jgi:Zn-dependent alcohol dehydrogenase